MTSFADQYKKIATKKGFIAALDQSGGSTPKALMNYGIQPDEYQGDDEMYAVVHAMRTRIMTSVSFDSERILGAILFENTLDGEVQGVPTATYLWQQKKIVPFLKVDKGLTDEKDGVQMMKPMPELDALLQKAVLAGVFGTKMRSVIRQPNAASIAAVVAQQFEIANQIIAAGLVPIIEPEVDINSENKAESEALLKAEISKQLALLPSEKKVMLKLTLPEQSNLYLDFVSQLNVVKVVALSGGYVSEEASRRLTENNGMIASFSRALTEGLNAKQTDAEFDQVLDSGIASAYQASCS